MATGNAPPKIFRVLWLTITPILVGIIMVFSIIGYTKITYGDYNVSTAPNNSIFIENTCEPIECLVPKLGRRSWLVPGKSFINMHTNRRVSWSVFWRISGFRSIEKCWKLLEKTISLLIQTSGTFKTCFHRYILIYIFSILRCTGYQTNIQKLNRMKNLSITTDLISN